MNLEEYENSLNYKKVTIFVGVRNTEEDYYYCLCSDCDSYGKVCCAEQVTPIDNNAFQFIKPICAGCCSCVT